MRDLAKTNLQLSPKPPGFRCAHPGYVALTELKRDPEIAGDIRAFMVALVPGPARADAAE